jgi:hypothetical protein
MSHYDNALHMMEIQGGSFVKALAHCYYMADTANREKLYESFAEYFHGYETRFEQWQWKQHEANCAKATGNAAHPEAKEGS